MTRRLIEYHIPLAEISEASAREKSIRHGHPSTLHIWWARRPLASSRATAFAALIDDPGPDHPQEREELEELLKKITPWEAVKDGDSADIEKARALILKQYGRPPRVLDPSRGRRLDPIGALRLGCGPTPPTTTPSPFHRKGYARTREIRIEWNCRRR